MNDGSSSKGPVMRNFGITNCLKMKRDVGCFRHHGAHVTLLITRSRDYTGPLFGGIHRSPVDSPHKDQWRGALVFSLICASTNGWPSNRDADDFRHHRAHYDVTVMIRRTGKNVIFEPSKPITSGRNWFITVYWFIDGTDIRVLTPAKWTLSV